ncbi:MAG: hypothetical protein L3K19_07345 [Thermoplasmata archaeon]|nr:hypothetical protein [Thermoplasmata archaeon]
MTNGTEAELLFVGLIAVLLLRRAYLMIRGTEVNIPRLAGFTVLYIFLWGLVVFGTSPAPPWYSALLDVVIVVGTPWLTLPFVERRVELSRTPAGSWEYRLPLGVPLAYVLLFVLRLAVNLVVLGENPFIYPPPTVTLTPFTSALVATVDALFSFSTGLFVARGVAVYRVYRTRIASPPTPDPAR